MMIVQWKCSNETSNPNHEHIFPVNTKFVIRCKQINLIKRMHFTRKNDNSKMSSAFLERLKMASYCSMTSLERISSKPFRRKMCNSESVPEVYPKKNDFHGHCSEMNSDCNDLTQCYSVTTGKVSTLSKAPSFSSLSSIEVAEINNPHCISTRSLNGNSSIRNFDTSAYQVNGHLFSESSSSEDVIYQRNSSATLPSTNRRKNERYIGPRIMSPLIKTSRVVRTRHNEVLCSHGINR